MEISQYVEKMKKVYEEFHSFIENEDDEQSNFETLKKVIKDNIKSDDADGIQSFLNIIIKYSDNHQRNIGFFDKIEQILIFLKNDIKTNFSNQSIFHIFKSNKRILLILIEHDILIIDESISKIMSTNEFKEQKYDLFFSPELKPFLKENLNFEVTEDFYSKRKEGENDSHLCELIRKDDINEFIIYSNQINLHLGSNVIESIFETNHLLLKNKDTKIIEYATFFGSIEIVKYLMANGVELESSLMIYCIHSNNEEMINFLVSIHKIDPPKGKYETCFKESIKCHHNQIAQYFENNFLEPNKTRTVNEIIHYHCIEENESYKYGESEVSYGIKYNNYLFIPSNLIDDKFSFFYLCESNNKKLVKLYLQTNQFDLKTRLIHQSFFLLESSFYIS